MKMLLTALTAVLLLSACGSDGETAVDAAGGAPQTPAADPAPAAVPPAPGPVATRNLATVLDDGAGARLCLGPVAESLPPQCTGPELVGWRWADQQIFEHRGDVKWGSFAVTGTFDGARVTVDGAIPAALYDALVEKPVTYPEPGVAHAEADLRSIQDEVSAALPGVQTAMSDGQRVLVEVTYDDGSLQGWADQAYGKDVVVVTPLLVDVEG